MNGLTVFVGTVMAFTGFSVYKSAWSTSDKVFGIAVFCLGAFLSAIGIIK